MTVITFTILWVTIGILGIIVELMAFARRDAGDTLSEHIWTLRMARWGRSILFPLWVWLTWHFFLEPPSLDSYAGVWYDDGILVLAGFVAAQFVTYKRKENYVSKQQEKVSE